MNLPITLKVLKALADETRLRIAIILWHYELSVNELVTLLNMGQSRISRHLKILTEAGILQARRDGLWIFYKASTQTHSSLSSQDSIQNNNQPPENNNVVSKEFLEPIFKNIFKDTKDDLDMAARIIEERAVKTRQFFNSIAEDWDELNREVLGDFSLPNAIQEYIPKNCAVAVDLGCGTGEVLEKLLEVSQNVIGVDGSPRMLELARHRFNEHEYKLDKLSLRIGELDHLPLRDAEANFACINLVLHHLSDPQLAINEIARILLPNGYIFISDFTPHKAENMRQTYGDRWLGFSTETLEKYLKYAGFTPVKHIQQHVRMGLEIHLLLAKKT